MPTAKHILTVGQVYGQAVVINPELPLVHQGSRTERGALLACGCGSEFTATVSNLVSGRVTSCGCRGRSWDELVVRRAVEAMLAEMGWQLTGFSVRRRES